MQHGVGHTLMLLWAGRAAMSVAANMASKVSLAVALTFWLGSSPLKGSGSPRKVVKRLPRH